MARAKTGLHAVVFDMMREELTIRPHRITPIELSWGHFSRDVLREFPSFLPSRAHFPGKYWWPVFSGFEAPQMGAALST